MIQGDIGDLFISKAIFIYTLCLNACLYEVHLIKHLLKQSKQSGLEEIEQVKFLIISKIAYFALIVHALLIPLFAHVGAITLALVNILSVVAWGSGIFLIKQGLTSLALRVFCLEVLIHAVVVCATLGLDLGFQFYLWTISCILMIDYQLSLKRAALYSLLMITTFALLYIFFNDVPYQYTYPQLIPYIHLTNIIIAGLPMVYAIGLIREITLSQRIELTEMASRDPLTKLYNRRFAKKLILATYRKSIEAEQSLCLVMADIDHFKQINDTYGHDKGDTILVNITQAICEFLNETDIAVRWGGEEFLLLLDNTDEHHGLQKIEALREHIATLDAHQELPNLSVTMSFGLIEWQPLASLESMLQQADAALYDSKDAGRNTTTVVKAFCLQLDDTDAVN